MPKLFRSNRSQALRIPKDKEFPPGVEDVDILVHGNIRLLVPRFASVRDWIENGPRLSDDFSVEPRDEPAEEREFPWK
jgi:antitoxin VapB